MTNTWISKTALSVARFNGSFDVDGDYLTVLGGRDANDPTSVVQGYRYDIPSDSWATFLSALPVPAAFCNHKAILPDGRYVVIGNDSSSDMALKVFVHDGSWTEMTGVTLGTVQSRYQIQNVSGALLDSKVYFVGHDVHRVYDIAADSWSTFTARAVELQRPIVIPFRGKLHVIGGGDAAINEASDRHDIYEPGVGWTTAAGLPASRRYLGGCAAGDMWIFAGGGTDSINQAQSTFWVYDPDADSWTAKATLPGVDTSGGCRMCVADERVWAYDVNNPIGGGVDIQVWDPDIAMPTDEVEGWGIIV